jgi:hypothetical protein
MSRELPPGGRRSARAPAGAYWVNRTVITASVRSPSAEESPRGCSWRLSNISCDVDPHSRAGSVSSNPRVLNVLWLPHFLEVRLVSDEGVATVPGVHLESDLFEDK